MNFDVLPALCPCQARGSRDTIKQEDISDEVEILDQDESIGEVEQGCGPHTLGNQ